MRMYGLSKAGLERMIRPARRRKYQSKLEETALLRVLLDTAPDVRRPVRKMLLSSDKGGTLTS
jgi:hypothetical protein